MQATIISCILYAMVHLPLLLRKPCLSVHTVVQMGK